jgi:hypothetical protein
LKPPTHIRHRIHLLALLVVTAATLLLAAAAQAGTVGFDYRSGALYYVASAGQANDVTVSGDATSGYQFADAAAPLNVGYGCTLTDPNHASCLGKYVRWLYVNTGDGDDKVSLQSMGYAWVDCGTGNDTLITPNTAARVNNCELVNPPAPPPATPVVTPPLSIGQTVATMSQSGVVPLTLSCSSSATSACTGTIVFVLPNAKTSGVSMSRRGAPNILGKDKFSVAEGKRRKVHISMTAGGRSLVKRRGRLRVTAKLMIKQGGKTRTSTQTLTIRAPRRHR